MVSAIVCVFTDVTDTFAGLNDVCVDFDRISIEHVSVSHISTSSEVLGDSSNSIAFVVVGLVKRSLALLCLWSSKRSVIFFKRKK